LPLRVYQNGDGPVVPTVLPVAAGVDKIAAGTLLTQTSSGGVAVLPTPYDATVPDPVRFIALEDFDSSTDNGIAAQVITPSTTFVAQISSGKADETYIGKTGKLLQNNTTGNYEVEITDTDPCLEIVATENVLWPYEPNSRENYNLVVFRFLPGVIYKAPQSSGNGGGE
jgi:hypothetical protein